AQAIQIKEGTQKEPFTISGNGKQVRDLLHADDVTALYLKAAEKIEIIKGQAFNVGGGIENSFSLLELFSFLESELDIKMEYTQLPFRESDQRVFVADISKAKELIGWKTRVSKEKGIYKMIDWVSKQNNSYC
ncbi:NAD-dependent epimerase/dehydratase family protein, partial [bacterium]|nr:NAD-dependent epimerase/dehydratase family protein [bacterium]